VSAEPAVLLISPGILKWTDMDFGLPHLVSMGGYVREHTGVRVELLDLNYEGGDHNDLARRLEDLGPYLVIGLSCYSSFDYMRVMALARFLKDLYPDVPLITGGYHASALPKDVVFDGSPFDAVFVGEGEFPLLKVVQRLLGGEDIGQRVFGADLPRRLDDLPPYQWDLLDRYWPHAHNIGRKFQIYLSRGCVYHCSFCMERAKSGYAWRAYSPERAVDELRRLATFTDLSKWVINIADPLFGFHRRWRREVLEGIAKYELFPRQYWTLTRSDDLDDTDIELLADARFAIGIGLESGSPKMLKIMQKGNTSEKYLGAIQRLARLSQKHGLNWATNIIVGHPGETRETMEETHAFISDLFLSMPSTKGWLSIDPFRLYPGSLVHMTMDEQEAEHGAHFYHREWWKSWYDHGFRAQHLDPSGTLGYAERVAFMHDAYRPLLLEVQKRFDGAGRSIDRVYERSLQGQVEHLAEDQRDHLLERGKRAMAGVSDPSLIPIPIGMNLKDPWIRKREEAVKRLLDRGALRSADLVEALLGVSPEDWVPPLDAQTMLGQTPETEEGLPPTTLGISVLASALEALEPDAGDVVVDLTARSGYLAAILSRLVGPSGRVVVVPFVSSWAEGLAERLAGLENVEVRDSDMYGLEGEFDRLFLGAAVPMFPTGLVENLRDGGRAVAFVGPRFRPQDLVCITREGGSTSERLVGRVRVPVLGGRYGWVRRPPIPTGVGNQVHFVRRPAATLAYHVLGHLDLGVDAANLYDAGKGEKPWVAPLKAALEAAPERLFIQVVGLLHQRVDALIGALRDGNILGDPALSAAFADALEAERHIVDAADPERLEAVKASLKGPLDALRGALWESTGKVAPPLWVVDCPVGNSGRATETSRGRIVGVNFDNDLGHILCQVLHEEMHPISDPHVLAEGVRDTRAGTEGYALHQRLETVAVSATDAFLRARAPRWVPDFERWCQTVGI